MTILWVSVTICNFNHSFNFDSSHQFSGAYICGNFSVSNLICCGQVDFLFVEILFAPTAKQEESKLSAYQMACHFLRNAARTTTVAFMQLDIAFQSPAIADTSMSSLGPVSVCLRPFSLSFDAQDLMCMIRLRR